jgi:hypothetical protein
VALATTTATAATVVRVLDVPEDEQQDYLEASVRDYLLIWRRLRRGLELTRVECYPPSGRGPATP